MRRTAVAIVALTGMGPRGGKPVSRTRLMGTARVFLIGGGARVMADHVAEVGGVAIDGLVRAGDPLAGDVVLVLIHSLAPAFGP